MYYFEVHGAEIVVEIDVEAVHPRGADTTRIMYTGPCLGCPNMSAWLPHALGQSYMCLGPSETQAGPCGVVRLTSQVAATVPSAVEIAVEKAPKS